MQAGGWQRETSDNSTWSSWASPVAENFSPGWQWPTASAAGPTASWAAAQPGRSEQRWRGRPSTGPGRGVPREEDGARAAVGPTDGLGWRSGLSWAAGREAGRERAEVLRAGGRSGSGGMAWAELGEARQGREDTQRAGGWSRWAHAVEGNQIRGHLEPDLRRTQRHTPPYTVPRSRSPLARGRVETPVSPRASSATRPFSHTFTHTVPRYRSPLARGRMSNPPCEAGVGKPASPRASSATRPLSPPRFVSFRFVSFSFVSSSFVSPSAPPSRPSSDRGGRQGGAPPASFLTSSVARSPSGLRTNHPPPPYSASSPVVMGDAVGPGAERPEEPGGREQRLANRNFGDEDLFGLEELTESYRRRPRPTGGEERTRAQEPDCGLGWRIHGSVEDTTLSTNKQHSLSGNGSGPGRGGRG